MVGFFSKIQSFQNFRRYTYCSSLFWPWAGLVVMASCFNMWARVEFKVPSNACYVRASIICGRSLSVYIVCYL